MFSIVALGWLLAVRGRLDLRTLADLALTVTSPALMFSVLGASSGDFDRWGVLVAGTLWIAAGTAVLGVLYLYTGGAGRRGLLLPAVFGTPATSPYRWRASLSDRRASRPRRSSSSRWRS